MTADSCEYVMKLRVQ